MTIGIYALIFPNGEVYIGSSTKSCEGRYVDHIRALKHNLHSNPHMQNIFNKYNIPEFRILQECGNPKGMKIKEIIIRLREDKWIDAQDGNTINCGRAYPCVMFGRYGYWNGKIFSESHRRKLSESRKGRIFSEETRKRLSKSLKGRLGANKGKKFSGEHKRKISESLKGKHRSNATRCKISKSHMGVSLSYEHIKRISESHKGIPSPMKGKTFSEEHRHNLSMAQIKRYAKERSKNNLVDDV